MIDVLNKICRYSEGTFLDVGVNVGQTLLKLKSVKDLNYIGFEPNINCVYYLNKLVEENGFNNIQIIPTAISNHCGISRLNYSKGNLDSSATMIPGFRKMETDMLWVTILETESIMCSLELKNISILKIDVEGYEMEVMESFRKIIVKHNPIILLEVLPCYEEKSDRFSKQTQLEKLIKKLGYKIFRIIKNQNKVESLNPVTEFGIHSNLNWSDYLLVP